MNPELAARITAAKAAGADYHRERNDYYNYGGGGELNQPDWPSWADHLAAELASLIETIEGGRA